MEISQHPVYQQPLIQQQQTGQQVTLSLDGVNSSFLASCLSFLILYEGVESCKRCSVEKLLQIEH